MSTNAQADSAEEVELEKTVTVVGYIKTDLNDVRQWADKVNDDIDYYEQEESIKYKYELGPVQHTFYSEEEAEEFRGRDLGEGSLTKEVSKSYKYTPDKEAYGVRNDFIGGFQKDSKWVWSFGKVRRDETSETVLSIYPSVKLVGMLKHPSQMDPSDPYKDEDDKRLAYVFRFRVHDVNKQEMEELTEEVIEDFIPWLNWRSEVERVRWYNCEQKSVDKGVCFRL